MTRLRLVWNDFPDKEPRVFPPSQVVTIGRSSQCELSLPKDHRSISRVHAQIDFENGGWYLWDKSSTGTLLDGERVAPGVPVRLPDGAILGIGRYNFTLHLEQDQDDLTAGQADEGFDLSVSQVDLAELDTKRVLDSAFELPVRLGEARGESDVYAVACRYLVTTLSPIVASAYVVHAKAEGRGRPRIVAKYPAASGGASSADMTVPAISRRVLERVVRDPDSVVFLTRRLREVSLQATVSLSTNSLGACFVEEGADGGPVLLYTLGEQTLTGGAGLVGQYLKLVATLTRQHLLTLRRARMSKYFSPKVVEMLMHGGGAAAAQGGPSVVPATSLFFDLRGFSLSVETSASDLLDLQQDLTTIITLVTQTVFDAGGTVIDYQGDAVFAAWGVPFAQADQAELAARCALKILHRLEEADVAMARNQHQARETLCGIGLCMGEVLAGTVGSREMFKYGLLGPSVNVAKRLESVTKPAYLHATVLCCEGLAQQLASSSLRLRRVARVRLGGMTRVENVYELIDPGAAHERTWQREHDERWNTVLTAVENARTEADLDALEPVLEQLPENHPRTVWLRQMALRLRDPSARAKWNGIINQ